MSVKNSKSLLMTRSPIENGGQNQLGAHLSLEHVVRNSTLCQLG